MSLRPAHPLSPFALPSALSDCGEFGCVTLPDFHSPSCVLPNPFASCLVLYTIYLSEQLSPIMSLRVPKSLCVLPCLLPLPMRGRDRCIKVPATCRPPSCPGGSPHPFALHFAPSTVWNRQMYNCPSDFRPHHVPAARKTFFCFALLFAVMHCTSQIDVSHPVQPPRWGKKTTSAFLDFHYFNVHV
jgi:hypothetical protein